MALRSPLINIMIRAAEEAAPALIRDFNELSFLQQSKKSFKNFLASAQQRSYDTITHSLTKARPTFGICHHGKFLKKIEHGDHFYWHVNPLVGYENFRRAIMPWGIEIICIDTHTNQAKAVIFFDPMRREIFSADTGNGCFLNSNRIRVSSRNKINKEALIGHYGILGHPHPKKENFFQNLQNFHQDNAPLHSLNLSACLYCYTAAARYDAAFGFLGTIEETAAAELMIKEAGGFSKIIPLTSNEQTIYQVIFSNDILFPHFIQKINL